MTDRMRKVWENHLETLINKQDDCRVADRAFDSFMKIFNFIKGIYGHLTLSKLRETQKILDTAAR